VILSRFVFCRIAGFSAVSPSGGHSGLRKNCLGTCPGSLTLTLDQGRGHPVPGQRAERERLMSWVDRSTFPIPFLFQEPLMKNTMRTSLSFACLILLAGTSLQGQQTNNPVPKNSSIPDMINHVAEALSADTLITKPARLGN
jgi:hypothetical protein